LPKLNEPCCGGLKIKLAFPSCSDKSHIEDGAGGAELD